MTIIIFLVDTSGSMNQRTYLGNTILDVAKSSIENFMKIRSRNPDSRLDRYMLLTFEEPPSNVKAGWKESHVVFGTELKNLKAQGLTALGPALRNTFDLLNVNRMVSGIDTYGQGRNPFFLEPAVIVALTDGGRLTSTGGVVSELILPLTQPMATGAGYTTEPFRWDQRLFGLVLRFPATPPLETAPALPPAEDTHVHAMCDVTGGRSYAVTTQRSLMAALESIAAKCQSGVVINLEKFGKDPNEEEAVGDASRGETSRDWMNQRRMIYVSRGAKGYTGHWPMPESFWPDPNSASLPPRSAHPTVRFTCANSEPLALENFPFDKYELEPSPLTQFILERRQPNSAWQCFIPNSAKYSELGHAFGYLKANTNLTAVNLFVMPYNYPILLPLLDDLCKVHKMKPPKKWRESFDSYLRTAPPYYAQPLRRALQRMNAPNLVPDYLDSTGLSHSAFNALKKLKTQAKLEYDRLVSSVGQKKVIPVAIEVKPLRTGSILETPEVKALLARGAETQGLREAVREQEVRPVLLVQDPHHVSRPFLNVFDIKRQNLLHQIARMRVNLLQLAARGIKLQNEDALHNIPVAEMGVYQEYVRRAPQPLREIETAPPRLHTFGNPFKVNKNLMIDEADEAMPGQSLKRKPISSPRPDTPISSRFAKRRKGALPSNCSPKPPFLPLLAEAETPEPMDVVVATKNNNIQRKVSSSRRLSPDLQEEPVEIISANHVMAPVANHIARPEPCRPPPAAVLVATTPSPQPQIDSSVATEHNRAVKSKCLRLVKKPGKDFEPLFEKLSSLQGTEEEKSKILRAVSLEARRFKRTALVKLVERFRANLAKPETNGMISDVSQNGRRGSTWVLS